MEITVEEQIKIIKKGAAQLIHEEELREKLNIAKQKGRSCIIKLGLDPSAPDIHLGHTVVLRKIRQLQDMGHHAVIIIGDFTGKIGDPTGKSKTRKPLSEEQVKENAKTYMEQIFKVIDRQKTTVRFNSEWLAKLNFEEVIRLCSATTVARVLERDDFQNRMKKEEAIGLHEFLYPIMQGYDSVEIKADLELGGTDQTFNILMGRTMQKAAGQEVQTALFMPLLEGTDGVEKMSKSLGNYIGVDESPEVMFKKVMEIPDSLILRYFELTTDVHPDRIDEFREEMEEGKNPRDIKLLLAEEITRLYHGEQGKTVGADYYKKVFSEGKLPDEMLELTILKGKETLLDIVADLVENNLVVSGSEFRRLITQGGISWNGEKVTDINQKIPSGEICMKIGKKKFVKLIS